MPVVSASTLTLIRATEQLLLAATKATTPGAAVLQGAVDVLEVEACRKVLRGDELVYSIQETGM